MKKRKYQLLWIASFVMMCGQCDDLLTQALWTTTAITLFVIANKRLEKVND